MLTRTLAALALVVLVVLAASACASLRNADGSINVAVILSDARWGLSAACDQQWVPADACTIGLDAFATADAVVAKNLPRTASAVRQVLIDVEAKLPATSRLRPYLDGAILLLPA
jgi:hypothetical protein